MTNNKTNILQYTVAKHTFVLKDEAECSFWQSLDNYKPFREREPKIQNAVFTLTIKKKIEYDAEMFRLLAVDNRQCFTGFDVYKNANGEYLFDIKSPQSGLSGGKLMINDDFSVASLQLCGSENEYYSIFDTAVMVCYMLATIRKDTLLMHSSVIRNNGRAYLFMGKSGTGKSTHSMLWMKYIDGCDLINDDNPVVRITDGCAVVYGSPWSGKTSCYRNVFAPIGGFVKLRQAKINSIKRMNPIEGYAFLVTGSSGMSWEPLLADGKHDTLQKIVSEVPCWLLDCLPDEAAATLCADTIRRERPCKK